MAMLMCFASGLQRSRKCFSHPMNIFEIIHFSKSETFWSLFAQKQREIHRVSGTGTHLKCETQIQVPAAVNIEGFFIFKVEYLQQERLMLHNQGTQQRWDRHI